MSGTTTANYTPLESWERRGGGEMMMMEMFHRHFFFLHFTRLDPIWTCLSNGNIVDFLLKNRGILQA